MYGKQWFTRYDNVCRANFRHPFLASCLYTLRPWPSVYIKFSGYMGCCRPMAQTNLKQTNFTETSQFLLQFASYTRCFHMTRKKPESVEARLLIPPWSKWPKTETKRCESLGSKRTGVEVTCSRFAYFPPWVSFIRFAGRFGQSHFGPNSLDRKSFRPSEFGRIVTK